MNASGTSSERAAGEQVPRSFARARQPVLLAPFLIGAAMVVSSYAETAGHWSVMLRPLAAIALLCLTLTLGSWMLSRHPETAALISSVALLLLSGHPAGLPVFLITAPWVVIRSFQSIRRLRSAIDLRPAITALTSIYLGVSLVTLAFSGAVSARDFALGGPTAAEGIAGERPNIYVLLLDGYARADTLRSVFGFDNQSFLAALSHLGFDVYADSHTEHDATSRTVTLMLSGQVDDLPPTAAIEDATTRDHLYREVRRRLAEAPALSELRAAGYRLVVIQPQVVHVIESGWDRAIDTGQINDFEINLLARSPLAPVLRDWVLQQQRLRILQSLEQWQPQPRDQSTVLMAHLMVPHPPFVFGDEGDISPPLCWPKSCSLFVSRADLLGITDDEFAALYTNQTEATNALVLPSIARMIAADPQAVVIVMSDHGSRYSTDDVEERHANLFAARTPGKPWLFGAAPTPRDLFRNLLTAYPAS